MYGNNFNPFMTANNMPYAPYGYGINHGGMRNLFNGIRNINWSNILNNTSKTLGVVREAIPVVREVGPMINNMRSMIKIASVFKDETDVKKNNYSNTDAKENSTNESTTTYKDNYDNKPNFFL